MATTQLPANIKAVFFDADGTLLVAENPYFHIARELGCEKESKELVHHYLQQDISYKKLAEREQQLFNGSFQQKFSRPPRIEDFQKLLPPISFRRDTQELITSLYRAHIEVYVLSSGIDTMVMRLTQIGISPSQIFANSFKFVGGNDAGVVKRNIQVSGDKIAAFSRIIDSRQLSISDTMYVGDNAFDRKIFEFVRDRGGWTVVFSSGEEKEAPLEKFQENERSFTVRKLSEISLIIKNKGLVRPMLIH